MTRTLADFGAEVIRVESLTRPDPLRLTGPYPPGRRSLNTAGFFNNLNAGKRSVLLDLSQEPAREIARRLIGVSDLVVENFRPGTMAGWGFGYDALQAIRPDVILVSLSLHGASGPLSQVGGFGSLIQATSGLNQITGDPAAPPSGPGIHYVDTSISPLHALTGTLAALHARNQSGQGDWVDCSQVEASVSVLGPALEAFQLAGIRTRGTANRHPAIAPHGLYRCRRGANETGWVALACPDDSAWRALTSLLHVPGIARDPRFRTVIGRRRQADLLDEWIGAWTANQTAAEVVAACRGRGIRVAPVQDAAGVAADPFFQDYFVQLHHPEAGLMPYDGPIPELSRTPGSVASPAPSAGQHEDWLLSELLGLGADARSQLEASGALL